MPTRQASSGLRASQLPLKRTLSTTPSPCKRVSCLVLKVQSGSHLSIGAFGQMCTCVYRHLSHQYAKLPSGCSLGTVGLTLELTRPYWYRARSSGREVTTPAFRTERFRDGTEADATRGTSVPLCSQSINLIDPPRYRLRERLKSCGVGDRSSYAVAFYGPRPI